MKEKMLKEIEGLDIKYNLKENEKFNNKNSYGFLEYDEESNSLYVMSNESDCFINEDIIEEYDEEISNILEKYNVEIIC